MKFEDFFYKKVLDKFNGQVIYQIEDERAPIDFKFISYLNKIKIVTSFRYKENIENPNSVEVSLREYLTENRIGWVSKSNISKFINKKMNELINDSYFYNIDVERGLINVSIDFYEHSLKQRKDLFSKEIFSKSELLKEEIIAEYESYSKFCSEFKFDDDKNYANIKINFIIDKYFNGTTFSIKKDSFIYKFKLTSDIHPKIEINESELYKGEKFLRNIDYFIKRPEYEFFIDLISEIGNDELSYLLNSKNYYFDISYFKYTSSLKNVDYSDVNDKIAEAIREKILKMNFGEKFFNQIDDELKEIKNSSYHKNQFNKIFKDLDEDELYFKLKQIFSKYLKNKNILKIGINSFKILNMSKNKITISTELDFNNNLLNFKSKKVGITTYYNIYHDSEYYFNRFKYTSEVDDDNLIIKINKNDIFNSNNLLERSFRNILMHFINSTNYLNELDKIWQRKYEYEKQKENEVKNDYYNIINELDKRDSKIKGDSIRW